jgi:hypothetical protein
MARTITFQSFSQLAIAEFGTIPKRGLAYLAIAGAAVAVSDLIFWLHRPDVLLIDYAVGAALLLGWGALLYAVSMTMMDSRLSVTGFIRFIITSVAMILPTALALGLLWLSATYKIGAGMAFSGVLFIISLVVITLLPGWPVMQAKSTKLIGPLAALRATRGIRWSLILAGFVTAGLSRALPMIPSATEVWSALTLAVLAGVIAVFFAMIAISIAVASAKLMLAEN